MCASVAVISGIGFKQKSAFVFHFAAPLLKVTDRLKNMEYVLNVNLLWIGKWKLFWIIVAAVLIPFNILWLLWFFSGELFVGIFKAVILHCCDVMLIQDPLSIAVQNANADIVTLWVSFSFHHWSAASSFYILLSVVASQV